MAGAALVAIRRDDGEIREIRERQRERGQAFGLIAVVVTKQYLHTIVFSPRGPSPGRSAGLAGFFMSRKPPKNINSEDAALFREAAAGAKPVTTRRVALRPQPPQAHARFRRRDEDDVLGESLRTSAEAMDLETGDEISFRRAGISDVTLRNLRRGKYAIEGHIDLHGMTGEEARGALRRFLAASVNAQRRCVRVIHGKGLRSGARGPVLKVKVNHWLRQWDDVLAFVSAPARDGGTGAVYVLLAR